jgi:hypothetical protein
MTNERRPGTVEGIEGGEGLLSSVVLREVERRSIR